MGTSTKEQARIQIMINALEDALASNAGVDQITVDGQTIRFADRASMILELDYWKREASRASGKRKLFRGVDFRAL